LQTKQSKEQSMGFTIAKQHYSQKIRHSRS